MFFIPLIVISKAQYSLTIDYEFIILKTFSRVPFKELEQESPLWKFFVYQIQNFLILNHYFCEEALFFCSRHYLREMRGSHSFTVSQLMLYSWPLDGSIAPSQTGSVESQRFPYAPTQPSYAVHRMWVKYDAFCFEACELHTRVFQDVST